MAQRQTTARRDHSPSKGAIVIFMAAMLACGAMFVSTALIVGVGMLPTLAALLVDGDKKKSVTVTVGLMNVAGVIPFIIELWKKGQTMQESMYIIQQPTVWICMYGAAAMGWLIVYSVPAAVQAVLAHRAHARIVDIDKHHAELVQLWGEAVKSKSKEAAKK